jgi:hypothetical protein
MVVADTDTGEEDVGNIAVATGQAPSGTDLHEDAKGWLGKKPERNGLAD